jgi:hypothetical protein
MHSSRNTLATDAQEATTLPGGIMTVTAAGESDISNADEQGTPDAPEFRATAVRRFPRRLAGVVVALVAVLGGLLLAAPAQADSFIAGVGFHTTVECGGSTMLFSTNTVRDNGSYAKLYVYSSDTGQWVTDGIWQPADAWASFHAPDITFRPGYYRVYMKYAQYTTAGWQYSGEYISTYVQRSGYSSWSSTGCSMG